MSKTLTATDFAKVQWVMTSGYICNVINIDIQMNRIWATILDSEQQDSVLCDLEAIDGYLKLDMDEFYSVLRPISDITDEEKEIYYEIVKSLDISATQSRAAATDYLDKHQLDCRGWIEQGLAIDATTLGERNPFKK